MYPFFSPQVRHHDKRCCGAAICLQPPAAGCDLRFAACGLRDTGFGAVGLWCCGALVLWGCSLPSASSSRQQPAICGLRIARYRLWCFGAVVLQSAFSCQQPAATCDLRPADRKIHALVLWGRKRRGPSSITTGSLCAAGLEPLARKHLKRAVKNDYSFFTAPFYGGTFRFTFSGTSHSSRLDLPGRSGRAYRSSSHPLRTRLL